MPLTGRATSHGCCGKPRTVGKNSHEVLAAITATALILG
jgi:hypothetical protein